MTEPMGVQAAPLLAAILEPLNKSQGENNQENQAQDDKAIPGTV